METRIITIDISWANWGSYKNLWKWYIESDVSNPKELFRSNFIFSIFRNIQKPDDGSVFVCIASNEGGEVQERITIHVQGII
jgi:hypothetical protein